MKSHEASPSRSFSMGRSIFLCLIILVSTSQAFLLYQDRFPINARFAKLNHHFRRAENYDNPPRNEIQETQQPRYLQYSNLSIMKHSLGPFSKHIVYVYITYAKHKMDLLPLKALS